MAAELGGELVALHLLRDPRLQRTRALVLGEGPVAPGRRCRYVEPDETLHLGDGGLALVGVEPAVWHYRVGGYGVLGQWLRARAGRTLTPAERRELPRIAEALRLTLAVQDRIEDVLAG